MTYDLTDEVKAMSSLNFEGNIIPIEWLSHIRLPNGKPDLVSIFLLADIIYWYRPTTIRHEISGKITEYRKKFKSDLLQKSYKDLEDLFGLSRNQIKDALQRLEKINLIKRIFRNINTQGSSLSNVMFIQIFPANIAIITEKKLGMGIFPHTSGDISSHLCGYIPTPMQINPHTYTETTTKITTKNSLSKKVKNVSSKPILDSLVVNKVNEREEEMLNIWNEVVEEKNEVTVKLTPKREKILNSRLKEFFNDDLSVWKDFCKKIASSKFLMGEITNFKAQFDWALKEENILKIIENNYSIGDRSVVENANVVAIAEEIISDPIWKKTREILKEKLGEGVFRSWISKLDFQIVLDNIAHFIAPTKFIKDWIDSNYSDDIKLSFKASGIEIQEISIKLM